MHLSTSPLSRVTSTSFALCPEHQAFVINFGSILCFSILKEYTKFLFPWLNSSTNSTKESVRPSTRLTSVSPVKQFIPVGAWSTLPFELFLSNPINSSTNRLSSNITNLSSYIVDLRY